MPSQMAIQQCLHTPVGVHERLVSRRQRITQPQTSSCSWHPLHTHAVGVDRRRLRCSASYSDSDEIMRKYGIEGANNTSQSAIQKRKPAAVSKPTVPLPRSSGNGVFLLLLLNVVLFFLDHVLHLPFVKALYLNHAHPQWWQWITHAFCHANWEHLSMNLFNLCVFGKLVEETEGAVGVIFTYILTAVGAAVASVLTQPAVYRGSTAVSVGASGAIFGLFAVSVLTRMSWDPRRLLEGLILGQFVVRQVLQEAKAHVAGGLTIGGLQVAHIAHLGGALAGVLLVFMLSKLPEPKDT
eukprot:jgi/Chrzof1/1633/Cz10g15050.t1